MEITITEIKKNTTGDFTKRATNTAVVILLENLHQNYRPSSNYYKSSLLN